MAQVCKVVGLLADKSGQAFPDRALSILAAGFVEKFADGKVRPTAATALMSIGESMGLNAVCLRVTQHAIVHKSPKVQAEALSWIGEAVTAFDLVLFFYLKVYVVDSFSCLFSCLV